MPLTDHDVEAIRTATARDVFALLGVHIVGDQTEVRVWCRRAAEVSVVVRATKQRVLATCRHVDGLFEAHLPSSTCGPCDVYVKMQGDNRELLYHDPYVMWPHIETFDLDRFRDGRHHDLGDILGSTPATVDGIAGVRFATWAPNATRVSVVGDWNDFDGRWHVMRPRDPYGVWEIFIPGISEGAKYKFEIRSLTGELRVKADPYARCAEVPPATASVVWRDDRYHWNDADWMTRRAKRNHLAQPMAIFECHLGSWARGFGGETWPDYRDVAQPLIDHCRQFGYTHIEFLPLAQHPYEGSWGYQVTGQFAPNSRHGSPDDLRALIDALHQADLGVIVDFVPGHFPKDDFSLAQFDGTPCYEYGDPREGEHKTWGTLVFNYRRPEVRNFLLAAALYWIKSYHIDALRVDAVSSMLYRNYDREEGEWVANEKGDSANLEAVSFLQEFNTLIHELGTGVMTMAEESTAWQGVTAPTHMQGLGFDLKWNMGWMHDTLGYLKVDPLMRPGIHERITFHQWYAYDDRWVLPLSHDEVVHGKRSLIDKPSGDWWQRRAQMRLLVGWQVAIPGRPLLFQGAEFGQGREWDWQSAPDFAEADEPDRRGLGVWLSAALRLYAKEPALHQRDDHRDGFAWVDSENRQESIVAFMRRAPGEPDVLVACNFTPIPRHAYPLGVSCAGAWKQILNSDDLQFGGSGLGNGGSVEAVDTPRGTWPASVRVTIPPLGVVFFRAPSERDGSSVRKAT